MSQWVPYVWDSTFSLQRPTASPHLCGREKDGGLPEAPHANCQDLCRRGGGPWNEGCCSAEFNRRAAWLIQVAQCEHWRPCTWKAGQRRPSPRDAGEEEPSQAAGCGGGKARSQGTQAAAGAGERDAALEPLEREAARPTGCFQPREACFRLGTSRTVRQWVCVAASRGVCGLLSQGGGWRLAQGALRFGFGDLHRPPRRSLLVVLSEGVETSRESPPAAPLCGPVRSCWGAALAV